MTWNNCREMLVSLVTGHVERQPYSWSTLT